MWNAFVLITFLSSDKHGHIDNSVLDKTRGKLSLEDKHVVIGLKQTRGIYSEGGKNHSWVSRSTGKSSNV